MSTPKLPNPLDMLRAVDTSATPAPEHEELPPVTTLEIDVVGTRGKRYTHRFNFRVPTLGDQVTMAKIEAGYLPSGAASAGQVGHLVRMIAYLAVTIDPSNVPEWWARALDCYDATPIQALWEEAVAYERRFHGLPDLRAARRAQVDPQRAADDGRGAGEGADPVRQDVRDPSGGSRDFLTAPR